MSRASPKSIERTELIESSEPAEPSEPVSRRVTLRTTADEALLRVQPFVHRTVPVLPGGYAMPLIHAAVHAGLKPFVCGSERGALFCADGLAVASRQVVMTVLITGPGAAAALQGIYCADANRNPLVVLIGETARDDAGSAVQDGSGFAGPELLACLRPCSAFSFYASTPRLAVSALQRAVLVARSSRRPTVVVVPLDVQNAGWRDA